MRRSLQVLAVALLALTASSTTASAHQGNPNMRSTIQQVTPTTPGVSLSVLNRDDRLQLINRSKDTITIEGYEDEPYARVLPNGTVQVNRRSPSFYLNQDRYAQVTIPKTANAKAAPQWTLVDRTGRFEWHDHRIHYMSKGVPPQVKDKAKETKVFSWSVPMRVNASAGAIRGELDWVPQADAKTPVGAIVGFAAIVLLGGAAVVVARRRRSDDDPSEEEVAEAW